MPQVLRHIRSVRFPRTYSRRHQRINKTRRIVFHNRNRTGRRHATEALGEPLLQGTQVLKNRLGSAACTSGCAPSSGNSQTSPRRYGSAPMVPVPSIAIHS